MDCNLGALFHHSPMKMTLKRSAEECLTLLSTRGCVVPDGDHRVSHSLY